MGATMEFLCDRMRQSNRATIVRMENFVEEQAVRKTLGPDLWKQLCHEFEREARCINEVQADKILIQRTEISLALTDSDSAKRLKLQYVDLLPGISIALANERGMITFRVNTSALAPSLTLMLNGQPFQPRDLVMDSMIRLTK